VVVSDHSSVSMELFEGVKFARMLTLDLIEKTVQRNLPASWES
jgi:hypothetical protein